MNGLPDIWFIIPTLQEPDEEYHFGFVRKEDGLLIGSGSIGPESNRKEFWHFGIIYFSSSHVEQNKGSGHVMEKCGLQFVKYGQFRKLDGSNKMRSMEYEGKLCEQLQ